MSLKCSQTFTDDEGIFDLLIYILQAIFSHKTISCSFVNMWLPHAYKMTDVKCGKAKHFMEVNSYARYLTLNQY
jgi:hypothetical protein